MNAFFYGVALQWKLDIRSKTMLITCYVVPLLFFAMMGGIFTSLNPVAKTTLIPSMSVMGVSMGALIGLPPSLTEVYASDIQKMYKANGVPLSLGLFTMVLSAFIHLLLMCVILYVAAIFAFDAVPPANPVLYAVSLAGFIAVSLSVGSVLGLSVKNQAKLTMVSQFVFLPSIMLSGILFPAEYLPRFLQGVGQLFPATWGYRWMMDSGFTIGNLWPLAAVFAGMVLLCGYLLHRRKAD